jgi:hypothetical protein
MTSWVSVSFIGILQSVADGVSRRHHRSPALASKPAGQDPGTRRCRLIEQSHTTARFHHERQFFLDNLIARFSQNGSWNAAVICVHWVEAGAVKRPRR